MATLPHFYDAESMSRLLKNAKRNIKNADAANDIGYFAVRKRVENQSETRQVKYPLSVLPVSYGDRFIPRRYLRQNPNKIQSLNLVCGDHQQIDIITEKDRQFYWRSHNYQINLAQALDLTHGGNLLNFHDKMSLDECNKSLNRYPMAIKYEAINKSIEELDWDCRPRSKPLAYNDSTHDMPGFNSYNVGDNIIDWNCHGQIAASFDSTLVVWGPTEGEEETVTLLYELRNIRALKYSPCGTKLALSINDIGRNRLQIWEVGDKVSIYLDKNTSFAKLTAFESIRCIEWDKSGKRIVIGLSTGIVHFVKFPVMEFTHHFDEHKARISDIRFSLNNNFLAIVDLLGRLSILRASNYEVIFRYHLADFIAWHPWCETSLLIGTRRPVSVELIDLKTMTNVAYYYRNDIQYELCAMAINPLSAELVVSFSHKVDGVNRSDILVMASMNRIVDNLSAHQGPVHFLLWDKTGTRIASAGQDESMNIWNFFGRSKRRECELKQCIISPSRQKKPSQLDLTTMYLQFR